jgi:hypothetical protein
MSFMYFSVLRTEKYMKLIHSSQAREKEERYAKKISGCVCGRLYTV